MLKKSKPAIWLRQTKGIYYFYTLIQSLFTKKQFGKLKCFLFFIGYPRSGSSTLASLLDAHKNIIISHELNIFKYIERGFNPAQIYFLIRKNSMLFNAGGRISSGYTGIIEGHYNGRAFPLKVIGDKKAGGTSLQLIQKPELLKRLKETIKLPIKCIHIVRNPFDMITTEAYGGNEMRKNISESDIEYATQFCFQKFDTVQQIINSGELDIITIRHEQLLKTPDKILTELLEWLGLEASTEYIQACKKHLYKKPHKSRLNYNWPDKEKVSVLEKINNIDFLDGYTF